MREDLTKNQGEVQLVDVNNNRHETRLTEVLKKIRDTRKYSFSGIGLLVYNSTQSGLDNLTFSMRPANEVPPLSLYDDKTIDLLIEIASFASPLHDGFHFFDENGILTRAAQYFCPPPVEGERPNKEYGTRFHAALFGSYLEGVIAVGIITHDSKVYIFNKGNRKCI